MVPTSTRPVTLYLGLGAGDTLWHSLPLIGGVIYILSSIPQMRDAWTRPDPASSEPSLQPTR